MPLKKLKPNTRLPVADVQYSDDVEADTNAELDALQAAIIREKKERRDAFRELVDTGFWFAACFQSREQKNKFFELMGWDDLLDSQYVNGLDMAGRLGVELQPIIVNTKKPGHAPKLLRAAKRIARIE